MAPTKKPHWASASTGTRSACSGDITETPKAFTLLGDPVVMVRRDGEIYALKDECPHRGTQLSMINTRKNLEFPGTPTITCAYHGWTYDVRDGKCVAVISEGPDSPVPAAGIRAKTYPIEVRRGMVWIWMGSSKPVPVEDDIPNLLLDPKAVVKGFYRVKWGNWRFHAENVGAGHAGMVHKSTLRNWFGTQPGTPVLPPDTGYEKTTTARASARTSRHGSAPAPRPHDSGRPSHRAISRAWASGTTGRAGSASCSAGCRVERRDSATGPGHQQRRC